MKQVCYLYECSERATHMIPHLQFPILVLPMDVQFEYQVSRQPVHSPKYSYVLCKNSLRFGVMIVKGKNLDQCAVNSVWCETRL